MSTQLHDGASTVQPTASTTLIASIALNVLLMVMQIAVGSAAHSSGVLANAVHSGADLVADALILLACRFDARARIEDPACLRPRCEPVALVGLGLVLLATGGQMMWEAAMRMNAAPTVHADAIAFGTLLFALVSKEAMFQWMSRVARRIDSALLLANAWHVRADAVSSLLATVAIGGTLIGFARLDDIAAAMIGLMIVKTGADFAWRGVCDIQAQRRMALALRRAREMHSGSGRLHTIANMKPIAEDARASAPTLVYSASAKSAPGQYMHSPATEFIADYANGAASLQLMNTPDAA